LSFHNLACYYCQSVAIATRVIDGKYVCLFCEHLAHNERIERVTKETLRKFYTAQYQAALLGLITFLKMTPDELSEEVSMWLHYEVDSINVPMKKRGVTE